MPIKLTEKQEEAWELLDSRIYEILLFGGSRSGKTFLVCYYIVMRALTFGRTRQLICRKHLSDLVSSIILGTMPAVCELISPSLLEYWNNNFNKLRSYIKFPNESMIWFTGFSDKKRTGKALGNEYSTIFMNEISEINDYEVCEDLKVRLAQKICFNRLILDCNPSTRAHWGYKKFVRGVDPIDQLKKDFETTYLLMNPIDNKENLPGDYISKTLESLSARQKARFRDGIWQNDLVGALWTCDLIEKTRQDAPRDFDCIKIGVDPTGSHKPTSDECGIMVGAKKGDHGYVLQDLSGRFSPNQWAAIVVDTYHRYKANSVVYETNYGGEMVKTIIHAIDRNVHVEPVTATRGKARRAEPIVALYEQGRIHHTRVLDELENQMTSWLLTDSWSPDRMDAAVWVLSSLLINPSRYMIY